MAELQNAPSSAAEAVPLSVYVEGGELRDAFRLASSLRQYLTAVGFDPVEDTAQSGRF